VSSLRSQDITIKEFVIETDDPARHIESLLSVGFGREVSFSEAELPFVRSVCGNLCNSELFEKTLKDSGGQIREDELKARLDFVSGANGSCDFDFSVIASHFCEMSVSDFDQLSASVLEAILSDPGLVLEDEDSLFEIVHRRASADLSYLVLLEFVRFEFVSGDCMMQAIELISSSFDCFTSGIWSSLRTRLALPVTPPSQPNRFKPPPTIDSTIVRGIPGILSVLRVKQFRLLYRGSRDGFGAGDFHSLCNGHQNTVTLISSTNHCIFGGYTPLAWGSESGWVSDPSLKSFVFTIKNPHNLPARIFKQKAETCAIYDHNSYGPVFGDNCTLRVSDDCRSSNGGYSKFGSCYPNDTGIADDAVLAGARNFAVEEIEVFEVIA
jgi:hypothetical protein